MEIEFIAILCVGVLYGLYLVAKGFKLHKQLKLIRDTPTSTIEAASVGPVELKGIAEPMDDILTAPVSGEDALFTDYRVEYRNGSGDTTRWTPLADDVEAVPFYVRDETGKMRVELDSSVDSDISSENSAEVTLRARETEPDSIANFVDRQPDIPEHEGGLLTRNRQSRRRRYYEHIIRPGDEVYLFGTVEPTEDDDTSLVLRSGARDMFFVSDQEESTLRNNRKWALWRVPVGAVISAVCSGVLLAVFGIL